MTGINNLLKKFWFQLLINSVWAYILMSSGMFDIVQSLALRALLTLMLGLPLSILYVWQKRKENWPIGLLEFLFVSILAAPFLGSLGGTLIRVIVYFVIETVPVF